MLALRSRTHRSPLRAMRLPAASLRAATMLLVACAMTVPRLAQAKRHHHPSSDEVIKAVHESARIVTIGHEYGKDHSEKAVKVTDFTEITVDGQKGRLHDLHPGMMVEVDLEADDVAAALDARHVNKK